MSIFSVPYEDELTIEEKTSIDKFIDYIINSYKNNAEELTQLAMQASTAINANESRIEALKRQNFFQRLFANISGKNRKIRGEIDRDFVAAQYASLKMIVLLSEQNKLTIDLLISIRKKMNDQFEDIYNIINDSIDKVSSKIEKLETSVKVLQLESLIEHKYFIDGTAYKDLDDKIKIICIISDFFSVTEGKYSDADLMMLKPMMKNLELDPDGKTNIINIYEALMNTIVYVKFTEKLDRNKLNKLENFKIPYLHALKDCNIGKPLYSSNDFNINFAEDINNFELMALLINELLYINNYDKEYDNNIESLEQEKDTDNESQYQDEYKKALSLFDTKNYNEAINIFEELLDKSPNKKEIYNMLLESYFYLSRFKQANDVIKQAITEGYIEFESDKRAAVALYKNNRYEEAISILKKLEYNASYDEELLFFMATIYRRMNYYTDSRNCYKKILDRNSNTAIPYVNLSEMAVCGAPDTKKVPQNIWDNHSGCIKGICPHGVKGGEWKKKALMIDPSLGDLFYSLDKNVYPKLVHIDMIDKYLKEHYS